MSSQPTIRPKAAAQLNQAIDAEVDSRLHKSSNERFLEAIESIERRTALMEQAVTRMANDQAASARATERISNWSIFRSVVWAIIAAPLVWIGIAVVVGFVLGLLGYPLMRLLNR